MLVTPDLLPERDLPIGSVALPSDHNGSLLEREDAQQHMQAQGLSEEAAARLAEAIPLDRYGCLVFSGNSLSFLEEVDTPDRVLAQMAGQEFDPSQPPTITAYTMEYTPDDALFYDGRKLAYTTWLVAALDDFVCLTEFGAIPKPDLIVGTTNQRMARLLTRFSFDMTRCWRSEGSTWVEEWEVFAAYSGIRDALHSFDPARKQRLIERGQQLA